jgi:serine/threonine protein kinase
MAGGDLASHRASRRLGLGRGLPPDEALAIVMQIAEGLAFAHRHGLVHRDLKPANNLMENGKAKMADFGIGGVTAVQAINVGNGPSNSPRTITEEADLFRGSGTLLYMCKEQRRGDDGDPRFDIYSLGVVWYQLLTGDVTQKTEDNWLEELRDEHQVPGQHIEWIRQCVGPFSKRPASGQALLQMLKMVPSVQGQDRDLDELEEVDELERDELVAIPAEEDRRQKVSAPEPPPAERPRRRKRRRRSEPKSVHTGNDVPLG